MVGDARPCHIICDCAVTVPPVAKQENYTLLVSYAVMIGRRNLYNSNTPQIDRETSSYVTAVPSLS
jgi:hypothetical protein